MRKAVTVQLSLIRDDSARNIKTAMDSHAMLRKCVLWVGAIIISVEIMGGRATVKALAQHFGIPLP